MPYKIFKNTGGQYCVHKKKGDGSAGKKIACHATMTKAKAQMSALYANEAKELEKMAKASDAAMTVKLDVSPELKEVIDEAREMDKNENKEQEVDEKDQKHTYSYVPWGVTTFADLEKAQDARAVALRVKTLSDQFTELVSNIMISDEIVDKAVAVTALSSEYSLLIKQGVDKEISEPEQGWLDSITKTFNDTINKVIGNFTNDVGDNDENKNSFMLWKEGDRLRWFARYSNNFRDRDVPPEIISANSHQNFVDMVDKKEADMPELWLWHTPEWKLGQADWLAYDDTGFALASGVIDRGKEMVAEQIAKQQLVGVSHGMPPSSIERDPDDPTVIVRHTSAEISPLPMEYAANEITGWVLLGEPTKEGNDMPIPEQKKQALVDDWNMDADLLAQLEAVNKRDADKATDEGVESKEIDETKEEEAIEEETAETAEAETTAETEDAVEPDAKPVDEAPSRQEVADAVATVLQPFVELTQALDERLKELEKSDEEKVATKASLTPNASVGALLAQQFSAIGDESARVDKRTKLSKSKPEETEAPEGEGPFSIRYLNQIVADEK